MTKATTRKRYEDIIFILHSYRIHCYSSPSEFPVAAASVASPSPSPSCPPPTNSSRWNLVKFGGLTALAVVLGTTAYATYANTLDEVEEKSRPLLDSSNYSVGDDASALEDLSKLNRDPSQVLYISGHASESSLQPENSVPMKPWKLESDDTALLDLIPFLEYMALHRPADIRPVLASYQGRDIASEFLERSKEHQRRMQEQKQHGRFWRR